MELPGRLSPRSRRSPRPLTTLGCAVLARISTSCRNRRHPCQELVGGEHRLAVLLRLARLPRLRARLRCHQHIAARLRSPTCTGVSPADAASCSISQRSTIRPAPSCAVPVKQIRAPGTRTSPMSSPLETLGIPRRSRHPAAWMPPAAGPPPRRQPRPRCGRPQLIGHRLPCRRVPRRVVTPRAMTPTRRPARTAPTSRLTRSSADNPGRWSAAGVATEWSRLTSRPETDSAGSAPRTPTTRPPNRTRRAPPRPTAPAPAPCRPDTRAPRNSTPSGIAVT